MPGARPDMTKNGIGVTTLSNSRKVRIEWGDCDPAGIIFYPRYFEIFDASTAALFERALGMTKFKQLKHFDFAGFPLVRTRAKFIRPTRFGDDVTVETTITFGRSSFEVAHRLIAQRRTVRRMLGEARLGGARSRNRRHQIAAGAARTVLAKFALDHSDSRAAIFFSSICREALAVARADDAVEVALVPARAARQIGQRLLAGRRHVEPIGAPVAVDALALDQSAPHQIFDHRRQARLVAAVGVATTRSG